MKQFATARYTISLLCLLVPAVLLGCLWWIIPANADDLWYDKGYNLYLKVGYNQLQAIMGELHNRMLTDNLRLANIFYLVETAWLPRQLVACLLACCTGVSMWLLTRIGGASMRQPLAVSFISITFVFLLQWLAFPFSHDFALNYIPAIAMTAAVAYMFMRLPRLSRRGRLMLYLLAFFAGFWHEGAVVPLICAFPVYMYVCKNYSRRMWIAWLALIPGVLFYITLPGFWSRFGHFHEGGIFSGFSLQTPYLISLPLLPVAAWLWWHERKNGCVRVSQAVAATCLCAGAALGAFMLYLSVPGCARAGQCGVWLSMSGWVAAAGVMFNRDKLHKIWWVSLLPLTVVTAHLIFMVKETCDMLKVYNRVLDEYRASGKDYIFCDMSRQEVYPSLWRYGRPSLMFMHPGYIQLRVSLRYRNLNRKTVFLPKSLEDVDINPGSKLPGSNPLYIKDGVLYAPYDSSTAYCLDRRYWSTFQGSIEVDADTFRTACGNLYIYIDPVKPTNLTALY